MYLASRRLAHNASAQAEVQELDLELDQVEDPVAGLAEAEGLAVDQVVDLAADLAEVSVDLDHNHPE